MTLRAALYGRMSTDKQNPKSADDQLREAARCAAAEGFAVVARFKDEGISGAKSKRRPDYQALLAATKRREFDVLVVEDLSRLARDPEHQAHALKIFAHYEVRVLAYTRNYDSSTPGHEVVAMAQGLQNAMYRPEQAKKTHRGQRAKAEQGFSVGGRAYGYRSQPLLKPGVLDRYGNPEVAAYRKVIDDTEAKVVRWIFRQYADGNSPRAIAAALNAQGVPSPGARWKRSKDAKRRDGKWMASTIHGNPDKGTGILCNVLYRGELVWNRTRWVDNPETELRECRLRPASEWVRQPAEELRIVSDELWDAVQRRRRATREATKSRPHGRPQRYPFSGLLFCAECGARYIIVDATRYGCASQVNGGDAACGNRVRVARAVIEEQLVAAMRKDLLTQETIAGVTRHLRQLSAERRADTDSADQARAAKQAKLEREVANLTDAIASGALRDSPALATRLKDAEAELRTLAVPERPKAQVIDLLPRAEAAYRKMVAELPRKMAREPDAARSMMKRVFRRVTLRRTPDGGLVAELAVSPAQLLSLIGGPSSGARENTGGSGGRLPCSRACP